MKPKIKIKLSSFTFVSFFIFRLFRSQTTANGVLHDTDQLIARCQTPLCLWDRHWLSSHNSCQGSVKKTHKTNSREKSYCIFMLWKNLNVREFKDKRKDIVGKPPLMKERHFFEMYGRSHMT